MFQIQIFIVLSPKDLKSNLRLLIIKFAKNKFKSSAFNISIQSSTNHNYCNHIDDQIVDHKSYHLLDYFDVESRLIKYKLYNKFLIKKIYK